MPGEVYQHGCGLHRSYPEGLQVSQHLTRERDGLERRTRAFKMKTAEKECSKSVRVRTGDMGWGYFWLPVFSFPFFFFCCCCLFEEISKDRLRRSNFLFENAVM